MIKHGITLITNAESQKSKVTAKEAADVRILSECMILNFDFE